jgi:hypothetical protein
MHIIAIAAVVIALIVIVIIMNRGTQRTGDVRGAPAPHPGAAAKPWRHGLAFISNGKLFYQAPGQELRELQSPHVRSVMERMERHQQLHGWKEGTSFARSYTGRNRHASADAVGIQATSAQFTTDDRVLYFLRDDSFGGLFEYDLLLDSEKRLLHKQYLSLEDLRMHPEGQRLLCAQHARNGAANIVVMDADGGNYRELTAGDTVDTAPAWVPGQADAVLFQSSGLARNEAGYVLAQGPTSIQMADTTSGSLTVILEDPRLDFLQPRVGANGFLYFIRRPYEAPRYGMGNAVTDALMFPFRLLRALLHYLNFFSLMYTRKPLITASGPAVQADLKEILIKGKRLDAEAALRTGVPLNGVPSLVPASWQLVCRSPQGEDYVLASHVASFDIASDWHHPVLQRLRRVCTGRRQSTAGPAEGPTGRGRDRRASGGPAGGSSGPAMTVSIQLLFTSALDGVIVPSFSQCMLH